MSTPDAVLAVSMDPAKALIKEIYDIRRNKVAMFIAIATACACVFGYAVVKLTDTLALRPDGLDRSTDGDNVRNPAHDDVPAVADDGYDADLDRNRTLKHGIDMALARFNNYNLEAEALASDWKRPLMYAEVKRDIKILDRAHDDWTRPLAEGDAGGSAHFSTANTLTDV
jgi:hypothetical protein